MQVKIVIIDPNSYESICFATIENSPMDLSRESQSEVLCIRVLFIPLYYETGSLTELLAMPSMARLAKVRNFKKGEKSRIKARTFVF